MTSFDLAILGALSLFGCAAGALGVLLVLRGRALLVDVMAHAALPGLGLAALIASLLDIRLTALILVTAALFSAFSSGLLTLGLQRHRRLSQDGAMAFVLALYFGLGVTIFGLLQLWYPGATLGLTSFTLGQVATMNQADASLLTIVSLLVLAVLFICRYGLILLVFDPVLAATQGMQPRLYDGLLVALAGVLLAVGIRSVGAILLIALLVTPACIGLLLANRIPTVTFWAALAGALSTLTGGLASWSGLSLPAGPAMTLAACALFCLALIWYFSRRLLCSGP